MKFKVLLEKDEAHRTPGWFEPKREIVTDKGKIEKKAPEHRLAQLKNPQQKSQTLSDPIPAPKLKESIKIPYGWVKTPDGYKYEHEIFRHHTPINSTIGVLHATLNHHYGRCHLYDRELSEITRLNEKKADLENSLSVLVPSDPAFSQVIGKIGKIDRVVSYLTKTPRLDKTNLICEEYSKSPPDSDENVKWQNEFMQKILAEADRLKNKNNNQPITSQKKSSAIVLKTAVEFVAPIISKMMGLEEPALITKSALNSFEVYVETENIEDAVISGIKSFATNYINDKVGNYIENIVSINNNESDSEYEAVLKGSIVMTFLYAVENIVGTLGEDKS